MFSKRRVSTTTRVSHKKTLSLLQHGPGRSPETSTGYKIRESLPKEFKSLTPSFTLFAEAFSSKNKPLMMRTCTSWVSAVMRSLHLVWKRHGKPSGSSNQHRRANIGRFHVVHDVVMTRVGGVHANVAFRVMAMR
jgi:hypothetical protein